jgi:hypothetical protein
MRQYADVITEVTYLALWVCVPGGAYCLLRSYGSANARAFIAEASAFNFGRRVIGVELGVNPNEVAYMVHVAAEDGKLVESGAMDAPPQIKLFSGEGV